MELVFIALTTFVVGICTGLGIGRFFCKWHHKKDAKEADFATKLDKQYNPLKDDCDGPCPQYVLPADVGDTLPGMPQRGTIGEEIGRQCGCSPGCCGIGPAEDCCGDKNCGKC